MAAEVSQLCIYPIKSIAGIALDSATVEEHGLAFDRRFIVATSQGEMLTGRTHPQLPLIHCELQAQGLHLTAPNMPPLAVNYADFSQHYTNVMVWSSDIQAQHCHPDYDAWLSQYLKQDCHLLYFGEQSQRRVKHRQSQVAFADGYPLLLISQASLDDLNRRCPQSQQMSQFRPNIIVSNSTAFAEDSWKRIRIGEVEFEITKPCSRCVFTTLKPGATHFDSAAEPLTTLSRYRKGSDGEIYFGQNMVALNNGTIKAGDEVKVLEWQAPPVYSVQPAPAELSPEQAAAQAKERFSPQAPQALSILFDSWDTAHTGDNQKSILDQAQQAKIGLNYSCRRGFCGRCKIKLQSGEVESLSQSALSDDEQDQGYILACRCRPLSDITLTQD